MATSEPSLALQACETALRELMAFCYERAYGDDWLEEITDEGQRKQWAKRAKSEAAARLPKGVAGMSDRALAFADFSELITIVREHWDPLAGALGARDQALILLERFKELRNTVAHNRPILLFERDLLSGIAGQIRNQVTLYMTTQDEAGDYYPRIESVADSFGRRIESPRQNDYTAGVVGEPRITVQPGHVVTFECVGIDPQGRRLAWAFGHPLAGDDPSVISKSAEVVYLDWVVTDSNVQDRLGIEAPRDRWRLQSLRGWSDVKTWEVSEGASRAGGASGVRASG